MCDACQEVWWIHVLVLLEFSGWCGQSSPTVVLAWVKGVLLTSCPSLAPCCSLIWDDGRISSIEDVHSFTMNSPLGKCLKPNISGCTRNASKEWAQCTYKMQHSLSAVWVRVPLCFSLVKQEVPVVVSALVVNYQFSIHTDLETCFSREMK